MRFLAFALIAPLAHAQPGPPSSDTPRTVEGETVLFERHREVPPFTDLAALDSMRTLRDSSAARALRDYRRSQEYDRDPGICLNGLIWERESTERSIWEQASNPHVEFTFPVVSGVRVVDPFEGLAPGEPPPPPPPSCYVEFWVDWTGAIHRAEINYCFGTEVTFDVARIFAEETKARVYYFTEVERPWVVSVMVAPSE